MSSVCKSRVAQGLVVVITVASSLRGGVAHAQDDDQKQVDASIKKAVELRKEGNDREALDELQRAAGRGHSPRLSAQTGLAEQALGLWPPAEKHLQEALAQSADPWIKKNRRLLEQSLATVSGHLASLDIWGPPDGAEVLVEGEPAGTLPLTAPIRVPADKIELTVRAKGFVSSTRTMELSAGANVREHVVLRAVVVTPQPPPAPVAVPGASVAAPPGPDASGEASEQDNPSIFTRWWFWTIAAVVVAGGVTAAILATRKSSDCGAPTCTTNF